MAHNFTAKIVELPQPNGQGRYFYMNMAELKRIFFHVGLGKTATTWLQDKVFPKFRGIYYIHPTKYRRSISLIQSSGHPVCFVSREMDQQLEREVRKFAAEFPNTKSILVLRSHESWIASQYRRFLKNGYILTFREFFDIDNDTGFWKKSDAEFFPKIEILEKYFTERPFVLFYEDLRKSPFDFIDKLASLLGAEYSRSDISLEPHHSSYEEKQLKVMLQYGKPIFKNKPVYSGSRLNTWLRRRSRMLGCYAVLYGAYLVPGFLVSRKELIPYEELKKIKEYFKSDWQKCIDYANQIQTTLKSSDKISQ